MNVNALENIFEPFLKKEPIFINKEVLRHSYTPNELPHRENEIRQIAGILAPALKGETPSNILIYGKTGTGKTIVSRFVCRELEKAAKKYNVNLRCIYINCEIVDTKYRILANLAREFGKSVPFTGWPTDKVYNAFKRAIDSKNQVAIILLDEIDKLVAKNSTDVIYTLTRINSELKKAKVSLIGISNDLKFTQYLDSRIKSSLGEEEIVFAPYNAKQLEDILKQRAELAFKEGVLEEGVIPLCAALAASEHGDARKALDLLRISGEIAEREGASKVTERHVRKAKEKIENDSIAQAIRTLPTQSKIILYAIVVLEESKDKVATTGEVYEVYRNLCRIAGLNPLTQRRVSDLISELDTLGIVNSRVVSKGRYGRTKEIKLSVDIVQLKELLSEDYRLEGIEYKIPKQRRLF